VDANPLVSQRPVETPTRILKRRADFLRVAKGVRRSTETFTVQAVNNDIGHARFGLTITKAAGTATERNRIRRRLRAALRSAGPSAPPADFVILARRGLLRQDFATLTRAVADALSRAGKRLETHEKGEPSA
jgi:ribonuclease P protein component